MLGCRGLLTGVFLVSLVAKLRGPRAYTEFVEATAALLAARTRSARPLALITVLVECEVVVSLIVPGLVRVGFVIAAALLGCFSVALAAVVRRGTRTPCRCFGATGTPVGPHHVVRNLLLIAVAATGLLTDLTIDTPGYELAGIAVVAVAVAACVMTIARLDDLVTLLRT